MLCFRLLYAIVLSSDVFDARARSRVCVYVVHWHCTAQFSMFNMEKRFRNKIIIIIIIIIICLQTLLRVRWVLRVQQLLALKETVVPTPSVPRQVFASVLTVTPDQLQGTVVSTPQMLLRCRLYTTSPLLWRSVDLDHNHLLSSTHSVVINGQALFTFMYSWNVFACMHLWHV